MRKQAELLERSSELSTDMSQSGGEWQVYENYEIRRPVPNNRGPRFLSAREKNKPNGRLRAEYRPLQKYPDLFLRFARLVEDDGLDIEPLDSEKNKQVALAWTHEYGTLGLTPTKGRHMWGNEPRGGYDDTVKAFASEAWRANGIKTLYEAATNPRGVDVDLIRSFIVSPHIRDFFTATPERAREWAITQAAGAINRILGEHTCSQVYMRTGDHRFMEGRDFRSLLGAMYLQAMWMLQADKPLRCRRPECPKIIDFGQPDRESDPSVVNDRSMGYRTRTDREYCSKRCANKHYYEREIKPRRHTRQSRRKVANQREP